MIQQTLREHCSDSTVLTVAHRITSVLESDMVLLLNNGLLEEYDSPSKLLMNKTSSFAKLVAEYSTTTETNADRKMTTLERKETQDQMRGVKSRKADDKEGSNYW